MKRIVAFICVLALGACASQPQKFSSELKTQDKKYNSKECQDIRAKSLEYDDKVGQRMLIGLASGLLLGPFGLPIAASVDGHQNDLRKAWNREIHLRCSSEPLPEDLKPQSQQKAPEGQPEMGSKEN